MPKNLPVMMEASTANFHPLD